jgi:hypothetical protein
VDLVEYISFRMLMPFYALARLIPSVREQSRQQELVTINQMIRTLYFALNHPPENGIHFYNVPEIKAF